MRKLMASLCIAGACSATGAEELSRMEPGLPGPVFSAALQRSEAIGPSPMWASQGGLLEVHERALAFLADVPSAAGPRSLCFAPDSDPALVAAFSAVLNGHNARANPIDRWTTTATNGGGLQEGEPITLTYSFVPDGTFVPDINGFDGNSNLRSYLDGIYGSQAAWQPVFDQMFARWSQLTGINYVYEPNDDGVTLNQNPGALGVRGDLRIAGIFLDGPSNVLAYNNFPNDGDMVIDTGDTFFTNTGGNSIRLRNVGSHEHGHGMGLAHVCPIEQEKLMEPFLTTAFDGPQHDDIRGAHKLYGDPFEPDNSAGQAVDLGALSNGTVVQGAVPPPSVSFGSIRSIDDSGEQDWMRFSVASPARLSLTLNPIGRSYDSSLQACGGTVGACCSGNVIDSAAMINMSLALLAGDGTTVLASADSGGAGQPETLVNAVLPNAGTYYVRVAGTGSTTEAQLYTLSMTTELLTVIPLQLSLPDGAPTEVMPGVPTSFDVVIVENEETIVPGTAVLMYRFDGGAFQSSPLAPQGGNLWIATIPAATCEDQVEFFVSVEGSENGVQTAPSSGAATPFVAGVGTPVTVASFDFETPAGWIVSNFPSGTGVFAGAWSRGIPLDDNRGDPNVDFDGSGQCWVTGNTNDEDLDSGETILTSPVMNVTGMRDIRLSYARWYSNTFGASPEQDTMIVEISDNSGATWSTLEVVGPTINSPNGQVDGGWFHRSFNLDGLVEPTAGLRVRFRVADAEPGSVVEAGVDAFEVVGRLCEDAPACACEMDGAVGVDVFDLLAYLDLWFAEDAAAEMDGTAGIDVFDLLAFLDCWFPASAGNC